MKQVDIILKAMLQNKNKKTWTAKDFQYGEYFVGYEATARMSDLTNMYDDLFIVGKEGRFRTLEINWEYSGINELLKRFELDMEN